MLDDFKELTEREKEVLYYLGTGCSRKDTSKSLHIKKTTVDKHIEAIYKKYDVQDKGGALLFGVYLKALDLNRVIEARLAAKKSKKNNSQSE